MRSTRIENTRPTGPIQKRFDHLRVSCDRLNVVAESSLPLCCAHIGGTSIYAISCVPPQRPAQNFLSPSPMHYICATVA
jgi:hypothetical protein